MTTPEIPAITTTSLASKHKLEVVIFNLPRIQMWARGGQFQCFNMNPTTTTSLALKCKPEVVHFSVSMHYYHLPCFQMQAGGGWFRYFNVHPTTTTSLASKREPEVVHFTVSMCLPPPPPSHPNASQRWFISLFWHASHHHLLSRIQIRVGGGWIWHFDATPT